MRRGCPARPRRAALLRWRLGALAGRRPAATPPTLAAAGGGKDWALLEHPYLGTMTEPA